MNTRKIIVLLGVLVGLIMLAKGLYIPAKAVVAQHLFQDAWQRTLQGEQRVKPWSWADTYPVARLTQQRLEVDQLVLSGSSGRVLAFGPGHVLRSASIGSQANVVLTGHRDTHFAWLQHLQNGDLLQLQLADGQVHSYRVNRRAVHDVSEVGLLAPEAFQGIRLITCYPFNAVLPGGPERFVVDAVEM